MKLNLGFIRRNKLNNDVERSARLDAFRFWDDLQNWETDTGVYRGWADQNEHLWNVHAARLRAARRKQNNAVRNKRRNRNI